MVIPLLLSARASPLWTLELAWEVEGEKEPLDPDALVVPGEFALFAETDCEAVF